MNCILDLLRRTPHSATEKSGERNMKGEIWEREENMRASQHQGEMKYLARPGRIILRELGEPTAPTAERRASQNFEEYHHRRFCETVPREL